MKKFAVLVLTLSLVLVAAVAFAAEAAPAAAAGGLTTGVAALFAIAIAAFVQNAPSQNNPRTSGFVTGVGN